MEIQNFRQTSKKISVCIELKSEGRISVKSTSTTPSHINKLYLQDLSEVPFSKVIEGDRVTVDINIKDLKESDNTEYSLYILSGKNDSLNYCEIVRQSESYLSKQFDFNRKGGYCILGRRNIDVGAKQQVNHIGVQYFYGYAPTSNWQNNDASINLSCPMLKFEEIRIATDILSYLTSLPLNTGPTDSKNTKYRYATFTTRIRMLINGEFAVQCSGFRDLFVWMAASNDLRVRSVDSYNYSPQFDDLITYGHSLCEIYIKSIQKWVVFDPWFAGLMILDSEDNPMSSEELAALSKDNSDDTSLVAPIEGYERNLIDGQGINYQSFFSPKNIDLIHYYFNKDLGSSMPGYLNYFHFIRVRNSQVRYRLSRLPITIAQYSKIYMMKIISWLN